MPGPTQVRDAGAARESPPRPGFHSPNTLLGRQIQVPCASGTGIGSTSFHLCTRESMNVFERGSRGHISVDSLVQALTKRIKACNPALSISRAQPSSQARGGGGARSERSVRCLGGADRRGAGQSPGAPHAASSRASSACSGHTDRSKPPAAGAAFHASSSGGGTSPPSRRCHSLLRPSSSPRAPPVPLVSAAAEQLYP